MTQSRSNPNETQEAREARLTQENLGLVISQAVKFRPNGVTDLDDYIQVGKVGLLRAIRTFNENHISQTGKPVKWSTYAGVCIAREIAKEAKKFSSHVSISSDDVPEISDNNDDLSRKIKEILPESLTPREVKVIYYRAQGLTLQEIGDRMGGYTKQWAKNLLGKAYEKIREAHEKTKDSISE